jgi:DnaJ like chaperone protein
MAWKGTIFGAMVGLLLTRTVTGAVVGALIGLLFDQSVGLGFSFPGSPAVSVSEVFFRTTFEVMGHVAKSDGRVSEAESGAAAHAGTAPRTRRDRRGNRLLPHR